MATPLEDLKELVLRQDSVAWAVAQRLGAEALPALQECARHGDFGVRMHALLCLHEVGGDPAVAIFLSALLDEHPQVVAAALRGLEGRVDERLLLPLLEAYEASTYPYARQQIALLLGGIDSPLLLAKLAWLKRRESDPEAREGCIVAMARRGDGESRSEFVALLHVSSEEHRRRFLRYCQEIHAPWLLKPLRPLLEDEEIMEPGAHVIRVNEDGVGGCEYLGSLRACDVAINLIASISGHAFSFAVGSRRRRDYSAEERDEARRYLEGLAG